MWVSRRIDSWRAHVGAFTTTHAHTHAPRSIPYRYALRRCVTCAEPTLNPSLPILYLNTPLRDRDHEAYALGSGLTARAGFDTLPAVSYLVGQYTTATQVRLGT